MSVITLITINPAGYYFYFWFIASIAIILGVSIYLILRRPSFRRSKFQMLGKASKKLSLLLSAPISLFLLLYVYNDSWGYFYEMKIDDNGVNIGYLFPAGTINLGHNISDFRVINTLRRGGVKYRLVINKDGTEYSSQMLRKSEITQAVNKIESVLHQKVKI